MENIKLNWDNDITPLLCSNELRDAENLHLVLQQDAIANGGFKDSAVTLGNCLTFAWDKAEDGVEGYKDLNITVIKKVDKIISLILR